MVRLFLVFVVVSVCPNLPTWAQPPSVQWIGTISVPGTDSDASEQDAGQRGVTLTDGSPANRMGGWSGIEWSGQGDRFFLLADRGAGDGAVDYRCRFHEVDLKADPQNHLIEYRLSKTKMISGGSGCQIVGSLKAHADDLVKHVCTAMDPEGIRLLPSGDLLICEEYGPRLAVLSRDGKVQRRFNTPDTFLLRSDTPGDADYGAFPNRAWEGVAITPSGNRIVAALQSHLIQDGEVENGWLMGRDTRWTCFDQNGQVNSHWVYQLDSSKVGVSEILAVDEDRFLVIERDGKDGADAKVKRIYLADVRKATDVSECDNLLEESRSTNRRVIQKTLFLDFLDPKFGITDEKPEGMCWGKPLPDGRRTLWVCWDNDFDPSRNSKIACFAIAPAQSNPKLSARLR